MTDRPTRMRKPAWPSQSIESRSTPDRLEIPAHPAEPGASALGARHPSLHAHPRAGAVVRELDDVHQRLHQRDAPPAVRQPALGAVDPVAAVAYLQHHLAVLHLGVDREAALAEAVAVLDGVGARLVAGHLGDLHVLLARPAPA